MILLYFILSAAVSVPLCSNFPNCHVVTALIGVFPYTILLVGAFDLYGCLGTIFLPGAQISYPIGNVGFGDGFAMSHCNGPLTPRILDLIS